MLQLVFQYNYRGDFPKSIDMLHQLLQIVDEKHPERPTILVFLAKNYMDIGDYDNALYFHREAAKMPSTFVYKNPNDSIPIAFDTREFLNKPLGFAEIFEKLNQLDSASFYIELAYKRLPYVSETDFWKSIFHWQILWSYGRIKQRLGQDTQALALFRQAFVKAKKTNTDVNIETTQVSLAQYFQTHHQSDSAIFYAKPAFEQGRKTPNFQAVQEAGFLLKSIYEQQGKAKEALYYYTFANNAKDTLLNIKKLQEVQRLSIQQERRNKELALTNMAQQNRFKLYGMLGGLLLALTTAVVLYRNNHQKQKLNEQLAIQKNEIETLNSGLEQKVEERTAELLNALNEVKTAFNNGQTTERKRVSADLHDEIGSALSSIAIFSDVTKSKAQKTAPELVPELDRIGVKSRIMIQTMRDTIWSLSENNQQSVWERMYGFSSETLIAKGIALIWQLPDEDALPIINFTSKRNLFLAYKEAINNIVKHAEASQVVVDLSLIGNAYKLTITDNGKGFDPQKVKKDGNGLRNFEERMKEIGGTATLNSCLGEGSSLVLQFPYEINIT
jgi:signal transduction histidine kinase